MTTSFEQTTQRSEKNGTTHPKIRSGADAGYFMLFPATSITNWGTQKRDRDPAKIKHHRTAQAETDYDAWL